MSITDRTDLMNKAGPTVRSLIGLASNPNAPDLFAETSATHLDGGPMPEPDHDLAVLVHPGDCFDPMVAAEDQDGLLKVTKAIRSGVLGESTVTPVIVHRA